MLIYLNRSGEDPYPFWVYQKKYDWFDFKTKWVNDQITITGKRSRQMRWGPKEGSFTLWLTDLDLATLKDLYEGETAEEYTVELRFEDPNSTKVDVTLDEIEISVIDTPTIRYQAELKVKEWV